MPLWGRVGLLGFKTCYRHSSRWHSRIYGVPSTTGIAGGQITAEKLLPSISPGPPQQFSAVRLYAAPVQVKPKKEEKESKGPRMNKAITSDYVRLVSNEGHSIVSLHEALARAMELQLDLVEVERKANPPVCKIMDYHKEKYQREVTSKNRLKSKPQVLKSDCKEVRFAGKIEPKDLQMKADMVKRQMERGYRVKCMATGTEQEDLKGLLSRFSALIEDAAFVESGPFVEKKQAYVVVRHIKFGATKKGRKATTASEGTSSEVDIPIDNVANQAQKLSMTEEVETSENDLETDDALLNHEADADLMFSTFSDEPIPEPGMAKPTCGKVSTDKMVAPGDISSHSEPLPFTGKNLYHQRGDLNTNFQEKPFEKSRHATGTNSQAQAYGFPSQVERTEMNYRGPGRHQPSRPDHPSPNQRWEAQESPNLGPGRNQPLRQDGSSPNRRWGAVESPNLRPGINQPQRPDYPSPNHRRWEACESPNLGPGRNQPLRPDHPSPNQRWEARQAPNHHSPAMDQKLLKQPPIPGNTKQNPSDAEQRQSVSSYGIFSTPGSAASGDPTVKSSSSGGISHSQDSTKPKAENQRPDADEASQRKWGIFSR